MEQGGTMGFSKPKLKVNVSNKRPDSLKLELLTIPENSYMNQFANGNISKVVNVGFRNISYTVKKGLFKRSEYR